MGLFLVEIMPLMFIPAAVGLLESWTTLADILLPVLSITVGGDVPGYDMWREKSRTNAMKKDGRKRP